MSEVNTINGYEIADKEARKNISAITDFIVETGVETGVATTTGSYGNVSWLYTKYNSGLVKMYGKTDVISFPTDKYFTTNTISYPITLIEEPIHISYGSNFGYVIASPDIAEGELELVASLNTINANNQEVQTYIKNIGSSLDYTNANFKYSVCVIGKWK